ncbi:MAG: hypothetical protein JXX29_04910 [Deltaproteobacteria bacterium]|nr:hypothetical protein [Deltaproteobacteria bacterium]MBN2670987.1 hypothetical protein [Deltaproteobacteria bacterium]
MTLKHLKPIAENETEPNITSFARSTFSEWKDAVTKGLKGAPYDKLLVRTNLDGITLDSIFTEENQAVEQTAPSVVRTGRRHGQAEHEHWHIGQVYQCASPASFAAQVKKDLAVGLTEIQLVLEQSSAAGVDVSDQTADVGVSIQTVSDMAEALPAELFNLPIRLYCQSAGIAAASLLHAVCLMHQREPGELAGGLGFSPLSQLAATGTVPCDETALFDETAVLIRWAEEVTPRLRVILIDGTVYQAGGSSASMELACCLSEAAAYLAALSERGISLNAAAGQMVFQLSVGGDFFEDIAKQRALRLLFAGLVKSLGGEVPDDIVIRARTSRFYASVDEPLINTLRGITATMSGALGGARSVHTAPFDESWFGGGAFAQRIARNTQVVLQQECKLGDVADPCGGSYYVEYLTDAIAEAAWRRVGQIDKEGGIVAALKNEYVQAAIAETWNTQQSALNRRKRKMIGVNDFVAFDAADNAYEKVPARDAARAKVDGSVRQSHSIGLSLDDDNVIAVAVNALQSGAIFSEVNHAVKQGEPVKVSPIPKRRLTYAYEQLRRRVRIFAETSLEPCTVGLLRLGTLRQSKPRTDFSRSFFNAAGFRIIESAACDEVSALVDAAVSMTAHVFVLCSTDEAYAESAVLLATELKKKSNAELVLAGRPGALESALRDAGMKHFIYLGSDHYELLSQLVHRICGEGAADENGGVHE